MSLLLLLATALPHAGATIEGVDVLLPADGEVMLETSVGLFIDPDGDAAGFEWICHEAVTSPDAVLLPRYVISADGVMMARMSDLSQSREPEQSVYRSEDGCSWTAPTGLTGRRIGGLAFHPTDGSVVVVTSRNGDGADGIWRSVDGGLSFTAVSVEVGEATLGPVRFGAGVWTTARLEDGTTSVLHSDDAGLTWSVHPMVVPADPDEPLRRTEVQVLVADPVVADRAWLQLDNFVGDTIHRTVDGGASTSEVYAATTYITDAALAEDGALWVASGGRTMQAVRDGREPEDIAAPIAFGLELGRGKAWYATRWELTNILLAAGTPGEDVDTQWRPDSTVVPRSCPAASDAGAVCTAAFEVLSPRFGAPLPVDTGEGPVVDDEPDGCACASRGPGAGWLSIGLLLALLRRKRARPPGWTRVGQPAT